MKSEEIAAGKLEERGRDKSSTSKALCKHRQKIKLMAKKKMVAYLKMKNFENSK